MKIDVEPFSAELFQEIVPLAHKCWDESTQDKGETCAFYGDRDFLVEPDMEQYQKVAVTGGLVIVTLRDTELVGYVIGAVYRAPHHKRIKVGGGDSIYIEPKYRSYTGVLVAKFEQAVKEVGGEVIGWPVHVNGPVYEVLKAMGYVGDDIVMEKRLCV